MVTIRLKVPVFSLFSEPYVQAKDHDRARSVSLSHGELKFERAEGTWAAAPGLDIVSDNGC
jgi:hypothetical protein